MILFKLLFNPSTRKLQPENYLRATGECVGLMFLVSLLVTFFVNPHLFIDNPIKDRIGYNSIIFSFISYPPASYIVMLIGIYASYFAIHYNRYSLMRLRIQNLNQNFYIKFSKSTNILYIFSIAIFLLIIFLILQFFHG